MTYLLTLLDEAATKAAASAEPATDLSVDDQPSTVAPLMATP